MVRNQGKKRVKEKENVNKDVVYDLWINRYKDLETMEFVDDSVAEPLVQAWQSE